MNLWTIISSLLVSAGLIIPSPVYISTFSLNNSDNKVIAEKREIELPAKTIAPYKKDNNSFGVKIGATSAAVMDEASGQILWQKNAEEVRSLASITKLMTTLVFLEHNPGWDQQITLGIEDEVGGGSADISRGEIVTVRQLFNTALISSDNNSATALVRSTGIKKEEFVSLMNAKAKAMNLPNTIFVEPTGLNSGNKSTAREILQLAKTAFADKDIAEAVSLPTYNFTALSGRAHKIFSTNWLLGSYLNVQAGKTGYIAESGYCIVTKTENKSGQAILTVILNAESNDLRYQENKILTGWTLDNYDWY